MRPGREGKGRAFKMKQIYIAKNQQQQSHSAQPNPTYNGGGPVHGNTGGQTPRHAQPSHASPFRRFASSPPPPLPPLLPSTATPRQRHELSSLFFHLIIITLTSAFLMKLKLSLMGKSCKAAMYTCSSSSSRSVLPPFPPAPPPPELSLERRLASASACCCLRLLPCAPPVTPDDIFSGES